MDDDDSIKEESVLGHFDYRILRAIASLNETASAQDLLQWLRTDMNAAAYPNVDKDLTISVVINATIRMFQKGLIRMELNDPSMWTMTPAKITITEKGAKASSQYMDKLRDEEDIEKPKTQ